MEEEEGKQLIILETGVPVECHVIHADMYVLSDMPYIVPILEHLRERGGGATAESLSAEMFMAESLCRSLLRLCCEYGLARADGKGSYAATPSGIDAIEGGRVFGREEGMWKVYIAKHGAMPGGGGVVRIDDGTREAGYMPWEGEWQPPAGNLWAAVRALAGARVRPVLGVAKEVVVRRIHGREKRIASDISLRLRTRLDGGGASTVLLASGDGAAEGPLKAPKIPGEVALQCAPATVDEAMDSLLGGKGGMKWDAKNARIAVAYDGLSDDEVSGMQKTMLLEDVEVGGARFETAKVTARIFPRGKKDARKWARHLFADMAADYVTREEYERLAGAIGDRLAGFDTGMGERAGHVPKDRKGAGARRRPRLFWLVQAMEDWDL